MNDTGCTRALGDVVVRILCGGIYGSRSNTRGGDKAQDRVLRVDGEMERVVGVDLGRAEVCLLEIDEEAGDDDCCEAVWLGHCERLQ